MFSAAPGKTFFEPTSPFFTVFAPFFWTAQNLEK
jgi:hypothetical protein